MTAICKSLRKRLAIAWKQGSIPTGVGLTFCAGVLFCVATTAIVWNWEIERQNENVQQQADAIAIAVQREIENDLNSIWSLGQFYSVSGALDRPSFQQFAREIFARHASIHSLAWIPRVSQSDRRAYEATVQKQGKPTFEILERTPEGLWTPAKARTEYFPMVYVESQGTPEWVVGFDFGSVASGRNAVQTATERGDLVATEAIASNPTGNISILMPVYDPQHKNPILAGMPNRGSLGREKWVQGFVLGGVRVKEAIEIALSQIDLRGLNVCLWDATAAPGEGFVAVYHSQGQQAIAGSTKRVFSPKQSQPTSSQSQCQQAIQRANDGLSLAGLRRLEIGGRQWSLLAMPTAEVRPLHWPMRLWTVLGGSLVGTCLPIATLLIYLSRNTEVQKLLPKLSQSNHELSKAYSEITLLNHMSDLLQACLTVEEAYTVLGTLAKPLFPEHSGGVFAISASKNIVEAVATWGEPLTSELLFAPDECLALRRGQPYWVKDTAHSLLCQHLHGDRLPGEYVCIPMVAHGEILGVFYLGSPTAGKLSDAKHRLAVMVARQIATALANLRLRERLQNQSIRDPLTNLYNRRYMEESLEREIRRAKRHKHPIGIIMLDVDRFKQFNDTYGHDAGDVVLRELGSFLQKHIRGSDIVCRYGGEEFTLILPEAPLDVVSHRAQQLRDGIKQLDLHYDRQPIGPITLSLGVASFPENGTSAIAVLQAADAALYQAKNQGRDRAIVASSENVTP